MKNLIEPFAILTMRLQTVGGRMENEIKNSSRLTGFRVRRFWGWILDLTSWLTTKEGIQTKEYLLFRDPVYKFLKSPNTTQKIIFDWKLSHSLLHLLPRLLAFWDASETLNEIEANEPDRCQFFENLFDLCTYRFAQARSFGWRGRRQVRAIRQNGQNVFPRFFGREICYPSSSYHWRKYLPTSLFLDLHQKVVMLRFW